MTRSSNTCTHIRALRWSSTCVLLLCTATPTWAEDKPLPPGFTKHYETRPDGKRVYVISRPEQEKPWAIDACPPMRVKMGSHVFAFKHPRGNGLLNFDYVDPELQGWQCQEAGDEPVEIRQFSWSSASFPPYSEQPRIDNEPFFAELRGVYHGQLVPDRFTAVQEELTKARKKLTDLPIEDGFYTFEYKPNQYSFISADPTFVTPLGNPVVFSCSHPHPKDPRLRCGTGGYWKDNISIGITGLSTTYFPKTEWKNVYRIFLEYVQRLEVTANQR